MNKKSFVLATFVALSALLTSQSAFALSQPWEDSQRMPRSNRTYYEFNSDCNLGSRTLRVGSTGRHVRTLEGILNVDRGLRGLPQLSSTGNYNEQTKKAVYEMQDGVLDLSSNGIVDRPTREAMTEFCFQYVGENVPRITPRPSTISFSDRQFIAAFDDARDGDIDFSSFGTNNISRGKVYVFESPNDEYSLGIRLDSRGDDISGMFTFVLIDEDGTIEKRVSKKLWVDMVYTYQNRMAYGTSTSNSYVPNNVVTIGDYRIVLQKKIGTSGVVVNVTNTEYNYTTTYSR